MPVESNAVPGDHFEDIDGLPICSENLESQLQLDVNLFPVNVVLISLIKDI
jgi:hypothetical protein